MNKQRVGTLDVCNFYQQAPRTMQKLDENCGLAVNAILGIIPPGQSLDVHERITRVLYDALRWTADDVLGQAVEDGYEATR